MIIKNRHFHRLFVSLLLCSMAYAVPAEASWIWSPDIGKWINPKNASKDTPELQLDWAMSFFNQKDWDRAIDEFEKLVETFPTSRLAAESVYYTGLCWEQRNDLSKASGSYQKLIDRYPYSDRIKEAIKREFEIANEFAGGGKVKMLGVAVLPGQDKALELYTHIVKNAPYGSYGDQAQFQIGELYKRQGEYELSRKAYQTVVDEYPNSELVPKARYQIAYSSMLASKKSQYDEQHAQQAIQEFEEYKDKFPVAPQALEADESIKTIRSEKADRDLKVAEFYEDQKKWKSAKVYYEELIQNYPETNAAKEAKKKLDGVVRQLNEPAAKSGWLKAPSLPKLSAPKISLPKPKWPKLWGKHE